MRAFSGTRTRRPLVIGALIVMAGVMAAAPSAAATAATAATTRQQEAVTRLDVTLALQGNGVLQVVERISYEFGDRERHGIFRDIPLEGPRQDITQVTATRNGRREQVDFENTGQWLRIRIGSADTVVTGKQDYSISYRVLGAVGAVQDKPGVTALSWDAIGDGWDVPIKASKVTVTSKHPLLAVSCSQGKIGSKERCRKTARGTFNTGALAAGMGVTIFAPLKPGHGIDTGLDASGGGASDDGAYGEEDGGILLPGETLPGSAATQSPQGSSPQPAGAPRSLSGGGSIPIAVGAFGAGLGAAIAGAFCLRRRPRATPVQYEPPRGLTPLQLGAAVYPGTLPHCATIAGGLLHLAQRGHISVALDDRVPRVAQAAGRDTLEPGEGDLLAAVLQGQAGPVQLDGSYLSGQRDTLARAQQEAQASTGISRHRRPWGMRYAWLGGAGVLAAASAMAGVGISADAAVPFALLLGGAALGMAGSVGLVRRRESADEARLRDEADGFRRLLSTDAARLRQSYAERTGYEPAAVAATLLPYAVVLEVPGEWLAAFSDVDPSRLDRASGVQGVTSASGLGASRLAGSTARAMHRRNTTGSSRSRLSPSRRTGVRFGPGFTSGRGFSGTRGSSSRSSGMRRTGGGHGGGGGGSW